MFPLTKDQINTMSQPGEGDVRMCYQLLPHISIKTEQHLQNLPQQILSDSCRMEGKTDGSSLRDRGCFNSRQKQALSSFLSVLCLLFTSFKHGKKAEPQKQDKKQTNTMTIRHNIFQRFYFFANMQLS